MITLLLQNRRNGSTEFDLMEHLIDKFVVIITVYNNLGLRKIVYCRRSSS